MGESPLWQTPCSNWATPTYPLWAIIDDEFLSLQLMQSTNK